MALYSTAAANEAARASAIPDSSAAPAHPHGVVPQCAQQARAARYRPRRLRIRIAANPTADSTSARAVREPLRVRVALQPPLA